MSAKTLSFAAELKDALAKRFTTVTDSFDTDGSPLLRIGSNAAAGQQTALIKIKELSPLGTDAIGNAARSYTPCVAQVVMEESTISGLSLLADTSKLSILGELSHRAIRVELYFSANGNSTGVEDILAANLKATFDTDLKWKTQSSQ